MEINRGQLERDLARAEKDRDKNDATRTEYEQRWTKLEEAKSRIAAQKVHLDSLLLKAPLDGMVLRRDGEVGEIAGPTDVLFWVGPPAPMQVVAEVNEEEINRIVSGQKAFLRSEAFPGLWLDPAALVRGDLGRVLAVVQQGVATPEHAAFVRRLAGATA